MQKGDCFAGIDAGTAYVKAIIIDGSCNVVSSLAERSGADLQRSISAAFEGAVSRAGIQGMGLKHIVSTGYGRKIASFANNSKTEISCHAKGAFHYFPKKITIVDIGGQDTKVIKVDENGRLQGFKMNRKCAAGTGAFLEEIAHKLGIGLNEMNALAARSTKDSPLGSYCTVFASTEILTRIKDGEKIEDLVKSAFESVARRVIEMDSLDGDVVMTGGVIAHNDVILKILSKCVKMEIFVPPLPQFTGAFGAALFAREEG